MFTKDTKSVGKVKSATMRLTRGRSKVVTKNTSNVKGTKSVGSVKGFKGAKQTKGRTKAVTASSLNSKGTKATGSTKGVRMVKASTKARNPQVKRPVVKPLQLGR